MTFDARAAEKELGEIVGLDLSAWHSDRVESFLRALVAREVEPYRKVVEESRKHLHYRSIIEAGMRIPCQGHLTGECGLTEALAALDKSQKEADRG